MPDDKKYTYEGESIVVSYSVARCIHAEECIHGLPEVFDREKRPWVTSDGSSADKVAEVVRRCPTGALHFERKDGGQTEAIRERSRLTVRPDGPLYVQGDLAIKDLDGSTEREVRAALCRCGQSGNKPHCDNSHVEAGFSDDGSLGPTGLADGDSKFAGHRLEISCVRSGPLVLMGGFTIEDARGSSRVHGEKVSLCRCGASEKKPFCDGSHRQIDFESDA